MDVCKRCVVSGKVQGVFYRASAQEEARRLGLTGWVRNLPGGRVETLACGDPPAVDRYVQWLWKGPARAKVKQVEVNDAEAEPVNGFEIRR